MRRNPVTNKIYVACNDGNVTVIDADTYTTRLVPVVPEGSGTIPFDIAVNPATNKIYVVSLGIGHVTEIDGATNIPRTLLIIENPHAIAVNQATNKIYVASIETGDEDNATITVMDGFTESFEVFRAGGHSPKKIVVNPVTNKIYVLNEGWGNNFEKGTVTVLDGATNQYETIPLESFPNILPNDIEVNPITNKIYVANGPPSVELQTKVTVIDGATNATQTVNVGAVPWAIAVNQATNKIYVTNLGDNSTSIIDGATNTVQTVAVGRSPKGVAVNPITNEIYVANTNSNDVTVITEQEIGDIPLTVNITPLPGNKSALANPTFNYTATSSYGPFTPPVQRVYYQVDTWTGFWNQATPSSGSGTFTIPTQLTGVHTLYAFAGDGQEATSINTGRGSSPIPGAMTAYSFVILPTYLPTYALTVTKKGSGVGTVTSNPAGIDCGADCCEPYNQGAQVTLTATAAQGSIFTGWSGGGCSGTGICAVTMNADTTVTATFSFPTYTLTVTKAGSGIGTVTSTPGGINSGADCSEEYNQGAKVTLTATAAQGSTFTGWSGGGCSGTGACKVTMNAKKTVTATFTLTPVQYSLAVTKSGPGSGTVSSNPAGIDCGADCSELYDEGTQVTLTAIPAQGCVFSGWSGGGCSGTGACTVTMNADTTVTATFSPTTYTLTVTKAGSGTGTVTSNPAGIDCGLDCHFAFLSGVEVTLTATPDSGFIFGGWTGCDNSAGNSCTVTMVTQKFITATFDPAPPLRTLTVTKSGTGSGTVASNPAGIDCGVDCSESYSQGTPVTLTATAAQGSTFTGWSGGGCSGTGACTVTMNADTAVTATFTPTYKLTVSKGGNGSGAVTSNPAGITCGADCTQKYAKGTQVTLTATPAQDSTFAGWSGGGCSGTGACTVTMNAIKTVTATFTLKPVQYTLTVTKSGSGSGAVTSNPAGVDCGADCSKSYSQGTPVTLTATAAQDSTFTGWTGGGCSGTGACTVTMTADTTVSAAFDISCSLTITSPNGGESWQVGTQYQIQWTYTGTAGSTIQVDLLKGGVFDRTIESGTSSGSGLKGWNWRIAGDQTLGADYRIRISSSTISVCNDTSDADFTITNTHKPNLTPYKPSGWSDKIVVSNKTGANSDDTPLYTTDTLYVDWAVINNGPAAATPFYHYLYIDGNLKAQWYTTNPLDPDWYAYVQDYPLGSLSAGTHTLKIVADSTGVIDESDESDNEYTRTITVNNPSITVTSPNGGQTWRAGTSHKLTWTYKGSPGNVKVQLLKAGKVQQTLSSNAPVGSNGKGSFTWPIAATQILGNDYKIRISSTTISSCKDSSNKTFSIAAP